MQVWSRMLATCATTQAAAGATWRLTWTDTTVKDATFVICVVKSSNQRLRWRATDWATQMKVGTLHSVMHCTWCSLLVLFLFLWKLHVAINTIRIVWQKSIGRYLWVSLKKTFFVCSGKQFQCLQCEFNTVSKTYLLRHMEQHAEFKVKLIFSVLICQDYVTYCTMQFWKSSIGFIHNMWVICINLQFLHPHCSHFAVPTAIIPVTLLVLWSGTTRRNTLVRSIIMLDLEDQTLILWSSTVGSPTAIFSPFFNSINNVIVTWNNSIALLFQMFEYSINCKCVCECI